MTDELVTLATRRRDGPGDATLQLRVHQQPGAQDGDYALFVWPSGRVLAQWVLLADAEAAGAVQEEEAEEGQKQGAGVALAGARVLELGAGVPLPSMAALASGAAHVVATDRDDAAVLANCARNLGGVEAAAAGARWRVRALDWNRCGEAELRAVLDEDGESG